MGDGTLAMNQRWRLAGGKLPLYERHMRALQQLGLGAPVITWVRTRVDWTLENLVQRDFSGIMVVSVDDDKLDISIEPLRDIPEDTGELGLIWDVFDDLLVPLTPPVDAASTLVRDLAKTLRYRVSEDATADMPMVLASETFFSSDEFGVVPAFGSEDGPVTTKLIECFDKLWSLE